MARALDRPDVAEAYNSALDMEEAGDIAGAVAAFRHYLTLDPDDHGGVAVRLAALGHGETPTRAADSYVETLFDQHAQRFEEILVDQLGYDVPTIFRNRLGELELGPFGRVLDLGCGTGLAAVALRDIAIHIVGLDLSSQMIDICEEKDIYEGLYVGEVEAFLSDNDEEPFHLITACDVLPYLGTLEPLFRTAAANLTSGGILAFSSETPLGDVDGYLVGKSQRFQHAPAYIERELIAAGFTLVEATAINVRMQDGQPTPGQLIVARLKV